MTQRLHIVRAAQHWTIDIPKQGCPTCLTAAGYRCLSVQNKAIPLPSNAVHVARVKANGYNVRLHP